MSCFVLKNKYYIFEDFKPKIPKLNPTGLQLHSQGLIQAPPETVPLMLHPG